MKRKEPSIKWKIFFFILIFAAILMVLLWLFQTVFLNDFYKSIKQQKMESNAGVVEQNIDNPEIQLLLDQIARSDDTSILITDLDGNTIYETDMPSEFLHMITENDVSVLVESARENDGTVVNPFSQISAPDPEYHRENFLGEGVPPAMRRGPMQGIMLSRIITSADGTEMLMSLYSIITPVNATVDTLRVQLIYITIIMVVCALALAFAISKNISRPITGIIKGVRRLARSDYDVRFTGKGYSEVNELADTLNYATGELAKTEKLRRELIANVSHDLRTPLATIGGYVEIFRDIPDEVTPENAKIVLDEVKHLTMLINDMLDLSKLQSGVQKLNLTVFGLSGLVEDTLARFDNVATDRYTIDFENDGPNVFVKADRIKLGQVVYNLVGNALTHAGEGKRILVRQELAGTDSVRLSVTDFGEGIDPGELENIWNRYYTTGKNHKRSIAGTGLGLSIVRNMLEMHGAGYGVESEKGRGSTFWFELPVETPLGEKENG